MAAKSTPLAIKVAIYHRLLSGHLSREIGRSYALSQPTVQKYANDAVGELRLRVGADCSPSLVCFLSRTLKMQCFQYPDDEEIRSLIDPVLAPYLSQAEKIDFASRESADQPLATRVSRTTEESFLQIVAALAQDGRPGLTPSALLRELVENYVAQHRSTGLPPTTAPQVVQPVLNEARAAAHIDASALMGDLMQAVRVQLENHGLGLLLPS